MRSLTHSSYPVIEHLLQNFATGQLQWNLPTNARLNIVCSWIENSFSKGQQIGGWLICRFHGSLLKCVTRFWRWPMTVWSRPSCGGHSSTHSECKRHSQQVRIWLLFFGRWPLPWLPFVTRSVYWHSGSRAMPKLEDGRPGGPKQSRTGERDYVSHLALGSSWKAVETKLPCDSDKDQLCLLQKS